MKNKILIIDDDLDICQILERYFTNNNFEVAFCGSGKKGMEELEKNPPDIVLCDFRLSDTDGKELLIKIKRSFPLLPVIIITGYSEIKIAVDVMKNGAFDYVTKPIVLEDLLATVIKAIELAQTVAIENSADSSASFKVDQSPSVNRKKIASGVKYIFGDTPEFRQLLSQVDLVAPTSYSVIISGESGSGKEAIAHEIHKRSKRALAPFIALDCGSLSNELAASELFGHEKGAFTGADNQKTGSVEMANGGTIFLDEISNLSYDIQASLLRLVQERKLRRVGGINDIELDIRIIVASNDRLAEGAEKGIFREDLFYRLNEFNIHVPPLRERKNDILDFAYFFLQQGNEELDKQVVGFLPEVEEFFKIYAWPGNLRELKNIVKRSVLLSDGNYIDLTTLPFELVHHSEAFLNGEETVKLPKADGENIIHAFISSDELSKDADVFNNDKAGMENIRNIKPTLKTASIDAEYLMIMEALKQANYNKSKAAKLLNVDRKTLYNKMKLHDDYKSINRID